MFKQIFIKYKDKVHKEDLKSVINKLIEYNYKICHGLDNISDKDIITAICIDIEKKSVSRANITCMACNASHNENNVMSCEEFILNANKLKL